ncbi:MAG: putative sulfate exporter family transporter [Acidobacteriota bacterium]
MFLSLSKILPGVLVAVAVAAIASFLHGLLPVAFGDVLGAVILAVLLGLLVGNSGFLPCWTQPGLRFSFHTLLRIAIVLLGARLSFQQVAAIGGRAVLLIICLMTLALVACWGLGRAVGVSRRLATLIGVGTAVCGNSAIAAVAPVIGAEDDEVSFAVATNTLFGTLAVFVYPLLGVWVGLSDAAFGTWAGTAVNDTSQVVAAGFAVSPEAGQVATAVKLTRNALMGPVIVAMGLMFRAAAGAGEASWTKRVKQSLPPFVLGFVAMALLSTFGAFDALTAATGFDWVVVFTGASKLLILVALAGVGLSTRFAAMRRTGPGPLLVGFAAATVTSLAALAWISWIGPVG